MHIAQYVGSNFQTIFCFPFVLNLDKNQWIPQQVHIDMAESAKRTYITCRSEGRDDVADILMQVADDLSDDWEKYDANAFVNYYDIANYAADYLTKASGNEGCECSEAIL